MRGAGSGMMRDVPLMVEMTRRIVEAVGKPVTVKTRLGWDEAMPQPSAIIQLVLMPTRRADSGSDAAARIARPTRVKRKKM